MTNSKRLKIWSMFLIFGIVVLAVLIFMYRQTILVEVGELLITNAKLEKADTILVLGGGSPERILEAADLYKSGYASRIILTRTPKPENIELVRALGIENLEEYELNIKIATKVGVPSEVITVLKPRVNSTYSEVSLLTKYCIRKGFDKVILVTSKTHTTRSYKIFRHLASDKIQVIPHPSSYDKFNPRNWWERRATTKELLYEYQKLANFYLLERW